MPMILVKKNPRGKVIRELSSEEETAVKTVCGLKKPATMALHNLANDILREMREYDAWLQCDCIPGDSPAMNFAALKNNTGTLYRGLTLSGTKTHVKQRFLPLTPLLMVSDVLWSPVLPA